MTSLRTGSLLVAQRDMNGYRYDPRKRLPIDLLDFFHISSGTGAIYLKGIPEQKTAYAAAGYWEDADLHIVLVGNQIIWQAWYKHRKEKEGDFLQGWKIAIP